MRGDDPDTVRAEYATEDGLRARTSVYQGVAAEEAQLVALRAVMDMSPEGVLEVGCGWGDFAKRVADETDAEVVALDLSPREYSLLFALMNRAGQVLERYDLLELAWDGEYENRSNVIDVYISYLRQKIDKPFGTDSIQTIRGVGYRLRA